MNSDRLTDGLRRLPQGDKRLLQVFVGMALVSLALGLFFGAMTAFARAGFLDLDSRTGYQMLTLHGVTIFFYWLYFFQAALILVLAAVYTEGAGRLAWRGAAWAGLGVMVAGFVASELTPLLGPVLLYNAPPSLIEGDPTSSGFFYLGYSLLGVGLFLVALSAIATALKPRFEGKIDTWSSISFAAVAWAGLLIVSALASLNAFVPPMLWSFGLIDGVSSYTMSWTILFHNVHYLPLMATVVMWYVLVEVVAGVKSIFGQRFSKYVFATYLIFVPPTSIYHMFLEPNLAPGVRVMGSMLSLFISVPTVLVFLILVASLEAYARAQGVRGLFGWIRRLPWKNPAMSAMGMAVVNLAIGGVFAFVLIQEKLAPLLSDTFFVPGYFHFLTLGTVTLTFIAALLYVIPGITGHALWRPAVLASLPYVTTFGLLIFGGAGIAAGYSGVPRRVFDVTYQGDAPGSWAVLMAFVGVGAVFMAAALAVYVYGLFRTLLWPARKMSVETSGLAAASWGGVIVGRSSAWVGPLAVLVLVLAMYAFTSIAFEVMSGLSVEASGGHL